jgi:hypothetical protein
MASGFFALVVCAGLVSAASAEDAAAPPAAAPAAPAQNPAAETAPPEQPKCIEETGDFATRGKKFVYVIGLENTCEKHVKCKIYANVTGARGTVLGQTIMQLGPKSSGAAAKKTYAMKVKTAGGTAQVSRECQVY